MKGLTAEGLGNKGFKQKTPSTLNLTQNCCSRFWEVSKIPFLVDLCCLITDT